MHRLQRLSLLLAIACLSVGLSSQASAATVKTLTAPEVKNMMEKGNAVLIHTLSAIEFEIQHIPGSINIPVINMQETTLLPEDKKAPIIFYCMGIR